MFDRKAHNALFRIAAAVIFTAFAFAADASAATFTVTSTLNTGAGSLRQAILDSNAAVGSDTIAFDPVVFSVPQTITLAASITISPGAGETLTINGPGSALLTIDGNSAVRIFTISGETVVISGLRLVNAVTSAIDNSGNLTVSGSVFDSNTDGNGGAIANGGPSLVVTNCTFTNNTATSGSATGLGGGAIYSSFTGGTAAITGSAFTSNSEIGNSGGGGAIRNRTGAMTISNSTFTGNSGRAGGGAIVNSDTMTISSSAFIGNLTTSTAENGGAIYSSGTLAINTTNISGNSATGNGGGIHINSGTVTVFASTIADNIANSDNGATAAAGGGIYNGGTVTVTYSTISGNQVAVAGNGGGINTASVMNLTNSTISGNSAAGSGGGIYASGVSTAITTVESCTIANNSAATTAGGARRASGTNPFNLRNTILANNTDNGTAPDAQGTFVSQGYNLIETTTGSTIDGDLTGNITGQDPVLGSLAANGGVTQTHALQPGSPAVDAADPVNFPVNDQRGYGRPVDGDAAGGARADIGAYEMLGVTAADVSVAGRVLSPNGRAISGAIVRISDTNGETQTTRTNTFGYFTFKAVTAGQTYILMTTARGYEFSPMVLSVDDAIAGLIISPTGGR